MANKALRATHGFGFATTLPGLNFAITALVTLLMKWLAFVESSYLPLPELVKYVCFANLLVVGMNASLMWNSVGFYQISKLSTVPVLCMLEVRKSYLTISITQGAQSTDEGYITL
ncbi:hypothetical protein ABZP36_007184 [Zizania latifolia]